MKSFIIFATLLLASCAAVPYGGYHDYDDGQYYGDAHSHYGGGGGHGGPYHGPIHIPVIHNGVPVETPEVQHAKAAHFAAVAKAQGHGHGGPYIGYHAAAPAHIYAAPYTHVAHHVPLTHGGVPVDTPEVQHAKAAHFAAHAQAAHAAVGHYNGAPADTPEVAHAKAEHFAAHAAARSGHGHHHLYKRSLWGNGYGHSAPWGGYHVPVIHNGVPVDTPEVQHAKAAHFAAHAQAGHGAGHYNGAPVDTPEVAHAKAAHFAAHAAARSGHVGAPVHHGGYHVPVIHNGVPVDTPEVQHAKAAHYAALAKAGSHGGAYHDYDDGQYYGDAHSHYGGGGGHGGHFHGPIHIPVIHNGVPVETPEVQHAKAAHFAAVAQAHGHGHGGYSSGHYDDGHDDGQYHHHHNQW